MLPEGALGFVGSSYSELTALSGRLYLGFNDDYYVDNSGAFSVTVRTTTPVSDAGDTVYRRLTSPVQMWQGPVQFVCETFCTFLKSHECSR